MGTSYFADFANEASVKDRLKLRYKNVKLFFRVLLQFSWRRGSKGSRDYACSVGDSPFSSH